MATAPSRKRIATTNWTLTRHGAKHASSAAVSAVAAVAIWTDDDCSRHDADGDAWQPLVRVQGPDRKALKP
eukprot:3914997-Prymnesium_polylepis.1